jgi:hypothetical protein
VSAAIDREYASRGTLIVAVIRLTCPRSRVGLQDFGYFCRLQRVDIDAIEIKTKISKSHRPGCSPRAYVNARATSGVAQPGRCNEADSKRAIALFNERRLFVGVFLCLTPLSAGQTASCLKNEKKKYLERPGSLITA